MVGETATAASGMHSCLPQGRNHDISLGGCGSSGGAWGTLYSVKSGKGVGNINSPWGEHRSQAGGF